MSSGTQRGALAHGRRHVVTIFTIVVLSIGVMAAFATSAGALPTCTDNYSGSTGGDWATSGNWSAGVPTATSVACIPSGTTVDVEESGDVAEVIQGTTSTPGSVDVTSGSLTLGP